MSSNLKSKIMQELFSRPFVASDIESIDPFDLYLDGATKLAFERNTVMDGSVVDPPNAEKEAVLVPLAIEKFSYDIFKMEIVDGRETFRNKVLRRFFDQTERSKGFMDQNEDSQPRWPRDWSNL